MCTTHKGDWLGRLWKNVFYVLFLTLRQNSVQISQKINIKVVKRVEVGKVALISLNLYVIIYAVEERETVLRC